MEKSLYSQYVDKWFPALVTAIVEKLNDKNTNRLTYLHKQLLTPTYSADGRWASILANYTRVAADVVSLSSELPLKMRDAIETGAGDIPKIGMKLGLTEKQMKDIDTMIAQGMPINQIVEKIFDDTTRCIEGVWEREEDMFLSGLSTGIALSERNNGTGVRIDYGYKNENKFGVAAKWATDAATATPIDDIQKIVDKAIEDDHTITDVYADDFALNNLYKSAQMRNQFAFDSNVAVVAGANVPTLDLEKVASIFSRKWGITLHRVARKVRTEINGVQVSHNPWQKGTLVFTCDEVLGTLAWTNPVEANRRVAGVAYETADNYILVSKYSKNDPLQEFTSSQAMAVPIINNVDRIYTLDSETVQEPAAA